MPFSQRLRRLALLPVLLSACAAPQPTSDGVTREQILHMITRHGEIATWARNPSILLYHEEPDAPEVLGNVLRSLRQASGLRLGNAAIVLDYQAFRAAGCDGRATSKTLSFDDAHRFGVQMPHYNSASDQTWTGLVRWDTDEEVIEALAAANIAIVALRPDRARRLYASSAWFDPDDDEHMDFMRGRNHCRVITRSGVEDGDRRIVAAYVFIARIRGQNLSNCRHEELIHAIGVGDDAEGRTVFGFNSRIPMTETQRANDLCMLEEIHRETDPEPAPEAAADRILRDAPDSHRQAAPASPRLRLGRGAWRRCASRMARKLAADPPPV